MQMKLPKWTILSTALMMLCTLGFGQTTILNFDETSADWTTGLGHPGNVILLEDEFADFEEGSGSMRVEVQLTDQVAWGTWTDIGYTFAEPVDFTGYSEMRFKMKLLREPASNIRSMQFTADVFEASDELWRYPEDLDIFYNPNTAANGSEWFEVVIPFSRFVQPSWYSTPDNGLFDPDSIIKFHFGVHADSSSDPYNSAFDTVAFLIDDLYLANPVEDGLLHSFDENAADWATGAGNDSLTIILEDDYDNMTEGASGMKVEVQMVGPYASWGTWTDMSYTFDTPMALGGATELRFDIKMLRKPIRKNLIFTADLIDVNDDELHRWGGDPERPGAYGLFNHIDIDYHEWREIVMPINDMFRPPWATTFDDVIGTAKKFNFGIHTTQSQLNDTTNAVVNDTVIFVIDNLRMTHGPKLVGLEEYDVQTADNFILSENYPNPFNPSTTFSYVVPEAADVSITVHNIKGELVNTLESGYQNVGRHQVVWNGLNDAGDQVSSGVYIYTLTTGTQSISKRMLLLK